MTVSVNLHSEQEEKVLLEVEEEILRRDKALQEGETTTRDWNDVKQELNSRYR